MIFPFKELGHFPKGKRKPEKMARKKLQNKRGDTIKLIVKSNELVDAKYMFDAWETRFFHALVAMINKNDEDDKTYRIWYKDVKKLFNLKSNQSYSLLREAARSLNRKPVYIGWMNDQFRRGREYNLFEFVDYLEAGQKGRGVERQEYVDIKIHNQMKPFLLYVKKNFDPKLTRYTSYDLRNIEKLQPYSMRIYELFKQHEYKGFRELNIQDLKDRFLITNEYPRFSTFYQRVVAPSIKAINKFTDITIPVDQIRKIKEGRRVVALYCPIESKEKREVAFLRGELTPTLFDGVEDATMEETPADIQFRNFEDVVVKSFGVTPSVFLKMLNSGKYSDENIQQAIEVTRRAKYNQEIKKSTSGFFLKALKDGYTDEKVEAKKEKAAKLGLKQKIMALQDEQAAKINDRIREITNNNEDITLEAVEAIESDSVMVAVIRSKEKKLGRKLMTEDYRQDQQLRGMVINNIVTQQKDQFQDILDYYTAAILELKSRVD